MEQGRLQVEGIIASLDGRRIFRDCTVGEPEQAESLGQTLADKLLAAGGREVLMELGIDI
jgi:hydroxymethylbilane synthase